MESTLDKGGLSLSPGKPRQGVLNKAQACRVGVVSGT